MDIALAVQALPAPAVDALRRAISTRETTGLHGTTPQPSRHASRSSASPPQDAADETDGDVSKANLKESRQAQAAAEALFDAESGIMSAALMALSPDREPRPPSHDRQHRERDEQQQQQNGAQQGGCQQSLHKESGSKQLAAAAKIGVKQPAAAAEIGLKQPAAAAKIVLKQRPAVAKIEQQRRSKPRNDSTGAASNQNQCVSSKAVAASSGDEFASNAAKARKASKAPKAEATRSTVQSDGTQRQQKIIKCVTAEETGPLLLGPASTTGLQQQQQQQHVTSSPLTTAARKRPRKPRVTRAPLTGPEGGPASMSSSPLTGAARRRRRKRGAAPAPLAGPEGGPTTRAESSKQTTHTPKHLDTSPQRQQSRVIQGSSEENKALHSKPPKSIGAKQQPERSKGNKRKTSPSQPTASTKQMKSANTHKVAVTNTTIPKSSNSARRRQRRGAETSRQKSLP